MLFELVALIAISPPAKTLNVVTTTQGLASIVSEIGGNRIAASSIVVGARDPHRIDAKPSYMSRVARADLFVAIGLDLEVGYERAILNGSRNARVALGAKGHLYASDGVPILGKPAGAVTRAQGDLHPYGNPHIWLDPYNVRIMTRRIAERMATLDPEDAQFYKSNAEKFVMEIDRAMFGAALAKHGPEKLWQWSKDGQLSKAGGDLGGWAGRMEKLRSRPIITYHRSWIYFVRRFDLRVVGELEPKPGLEPTPGNLAAVIKSGQAERVKVIIQEPFYSTRHAQFVASRIGAKAVVVPGNVGHMPEAKDYISMMNIIVSRIASALGG